MSETGVVEIHGKEYLTVARRIRDFRDKHPDYSIKTKLLSNAELVLVKATISDNDGNVLSTGHAEEIRNATKILSTSCVETTETSAVGRCLSLLGFLGSHIAGAEEMAEAVAQQDALDVVERLKAHNAAVRDHIESITAIKAYLLNDEYSAAYEAYSEIPDEDKKRLTLAPTKGGIWTTEEIKKLRSNEWTAARREFHGLEE